MEKLPEAIIRETIQHVKKIKLIKKGFSKDRKFKVTLENGKKLFIRMCDITISERRKEEFFLTQELKNKGVSVPVPIEFMELSQHGVCLQIYEYIYGKDGEVCLNSLTDSEQYQIGYEGGQALKVIHSIVKEEKVVNWEKSFKRKYERYLNRLKEIDKFTVPLESIHLFVKEHIHLLKDRPTVFLHDDFHPANIMIHNKRLAAIIDFDRYDWGDPIHDFYKIALFTRNVSVPFAIGQINGYYNNQVPNDFWKLYSLYAAMSFVPDIVWSQNNTPHLLKNMEDRLNQILEDHHNFTSFIPNWFQVNNEKDNLSIS